MFTAIDLAAEGEDCWENGRAAHERCANEMKCLRKDYSDNAPYPVDLGCNRKHCCTVVVAAPTPEPEGMC